MTALEVVFGLIQNIRVVIDGEQMHLACYVTAKTMTP